MEAPKEEEEARIVFPQENANNGGSYQEHQRARIDRVNPSENDFPTDANVLTAAATPPPPTETANSTDGASPPPVIPHDPLLEKKKLAKLSYFAPHSTRETDKLKAKATGGAASKEEEDHIRFPEDRELDAGYRERDRRRNDAINNPITGEEAPSSASATSETASAQSHDTTRRQVEVPLDPAASKRKIAGLSYFAPASTREMEKQKSAANVSSATPSGNAANMYEAIPGAHNCKPSTNSNSTGEETSDAAPRRSNLLDSMTPTGPSLAEQQHYANNNENGNDPANPAAETQPGAYDSKKAPDPTRFKQQAQKNRPSYMAAFDDPSSTLSLPEEQADAPDDSSPPTEAPPQTPLFPREPGAHSFGTTSNDLRGSIVIGNGDATSPEMNNPNTDNPNVIDGSSNNNPNTGIQDPNANIALDLANLLPMAQQVDEEGANSDVVSIATLENFDKKVQRQEKTKAFLRRIAMVAFVVLVAFFVGLALGARFLKRSPDPTTPAPTTSAPTTAAPTPASTPEEILLLDRILPDYTKASIEKDPESPQARAYDWMLEELTDDAYPLNRLSNPNRIIQRFALATFYYSTEGAEWFENEGWLNHSLHECLWYGKPWFSSVPYGGFDARFSFNENPNACEWPSTQLTDHYKGHEIYKHFWLYENGLGGTIPPELGLLTTLVSMYLYKGFYGGKLPSQIGSLQRLSVLNVAVNDLTGTLPTELGLMYSMRGISIFNTKIEGRIPSEIGKLTRCSTFKVDGNFHTGTIPTELGLVTDMYNMYFFQNMFTGTIPLDIMGAKLTSLAFYGNQMSGTIPTELGLYPRLEHIVVHNNQLTGTIPSELGLLPKLRIFQVSENQLVRRIPTELGLCNKMQTFYVGQNQLTGFIPSEIGQWTNLGYMELSQNLLSGTIPTEFPSLNWDFWFPMMFFLEGNHLSGTIPPNFALKFENISFLELANNPLLSGTVPEALCGIEKLDFDCTGLLCGCNCNCSGNMNGTDNGNATML